MAKRHWFQGQLISKSWDRVLEEAWHDGIRFKINDAKRTIKMQENRVKRFGLYNPISNPDGAAAPSHTAPHVRTGRPDHALDIDTYTPPGGRDALIAWLRKNGVPMANTVSTEPWHWETTSAIALVKFARRCRKAQKRRAKRRKNSKKKRK